MLKTSRRVEILPDDLTTHQFTDAVTRVSGMPARDRIRTKKSLGEIMVLAHASVYVQQGQDVFVLIDDRDGRRRASREAQWLRDQGHTKRLDLWSTRRVLQEAGRHEDWILPRSGRQHIQQPREHLPLPRAAQLHHVAVDDQIDVIGEPS